MNKKPCVRCERLIDPVARLCPYCNWDQEVAPPPPSPLVSAVEMEERDEQRSAERRQKLKKVMLVAGVAALLLATFAIGGFVSQLGKKAEDKKPADIGTDEVPPMLPDADEVTDLRLVPVDLTTTVGRSITSAPQVAGTTTAVAGQNRSDTTALPSQHYVRMAHRADQAQKAAERNADADTIDPRTIRPTPIPQPRRPAPEPAEKAAPEEERGGRRTRPEPISQPLPDIDARGTARFRLPIGPDGRVREVEVLKTIPGATSELVAAIQRWRFRPATQNGRPVEGTHLVDISFQGRE